MSSNESSAAVTSSLNAHDGAAIAVCGPSPAQLDPSTPPSEKWCNTDLKVSRFTCTWTINNFSYCPEQMGESLKSATFSCPNDELKWRLRIFPKGLHEESKDYISLFLILVVESNEGRIRAKFKFSTLNFRHEKTMKSRKIAYNFIPGEGRGIEKFIRRDVLFNKANGLLPDDKLTIFCEVSVLSGRVNTVGQSTLKFEVPQCSLSEDMATLLENEKLSDVVLVVGTKEFCAHKAILAARSKVFEAMFQHNMIEKQQNKVEIQDVDESVFEEMLRFIYTGKAKHLSTIGTKLLAVADRYELNRLKAMCEEALSSHSLNIESAADILVLADLHNANQLKQRTLEFINIHAAQVTETSSWAKLESTHSYLLKDAYRALALQQAQLSASLEKQLKLN